MLRYKDLKNMAYVPLTKEEFKEIINKLDPILKYYYDWESHHDFVLLVDLDLKDGSKYRLKGSQLREIFQYMNKYTIEEFKKCVLLFEL